MERVYSDSLCRIFLQRMLEWLSRKDFCGNNGIGWEISDLCANLIWTLYTGASIIYFYYKQILFQISR